MPLATSGFETPIQMPHEELIHCTRKARQIERNWSVEAARCVRVTQLGLQTPIQWQNTDRIVSITASQIVLTTYVDGLFCWDTERNQPMGYLDLEHGWDIETHSAITDCNERVVYLMAGLQVSRPS